MMWSEGTGYWGIGKYLTGEEQFSSRNDLHWAPNEVLLHPKAGDAPWGLVVGWKPPDDMLIDIAYSFALASPHSSGIGYRITKRGGEGDTDIVVLHNIGSGIHNELNGVSVAKGDQPKRLCFWQGRWHLFYQAYPPDEFPNPQDIKKRHQHWGHAVSADLVHWRDLPYAIYPDVERMCFSGSTLVESDRVVAVYP